MMTEALNAHGLFFKKRVRSEVEAMRSAFILGEEYPVPYLEGASIDLLVEFRRSYPTYNNVLRYILPIECKRGYTAAKRWIFFKDRGYDSKQKLFYEFVGNECQICDAAALVGNDVPLCIEGVEVDLSRLQKKGELYKAANPDPIWKAGFQVCKGSLGFLLQEVNQRKLRKIDCNDYESNFRLLPLLLTTAPLSVCELDPQSVDILSGNHQSEVVTTDVPYLILQYPFTPSAEYGTDPRTALLGDPE